MKVGLFGFGRAGKAVATVILQSKEANLCWVIRKKVPCNMVQCQSFLGLKVMNKV
jgi:4-hydroxy-tetrahydrodipicolinate reductase